METPVRDQGSGVRGQAVRSTVLFPAGAGEHWALTLEDLDAPGPEYIAMFGQDERRLHSIAADLIQNGDGRTRARVIPINIDRLGGLEFTKERKADGRQTRQEG